ncbi:MAG: T9SS type A sorting domain-containing protein [Candidatus Eisenbacteria bacterium]|uniref:T9SS type A sorting domain-containing protein n=1 Tax=Eiseniibacteriota bacterium TaxID=2212470 RepID=A0A933SB87_UNCEI|nr:T9SS type A sorting domain-containing protein [Candidatus Eisenbacteria bacterium]
MKCFRHLFVFACVALSFAAWATPRAHADALQQTYTIPGWRLEKLLGNTDGDLAYEMLMVNRASGYYGVFDAGTGALQKPFTSITPATGWIEPIDFDGDGRAELVARVDDGVHRDVVVWRDSLGSYYVRFSHTEPVVSQFGDKVRSTTFKDLVEVQPGDVVVRNWTNGAELMRASTAGPGWNTTHQADARPVDVDGDGIDELLLLNFGVSCRLYKWNGTQYVMLWIKTGNWFFDQSFNCDTDSHREMALIDLNGNGGLGRYRILDGLTGATELDPSAFTGSYSFQPVDHDGDGIMELFFTQTVPTSLTAAYQWNGLTYQTSFSHADLTTLVQPVRMRATTQTEYIETLPGDLRIRSSAGFVLFDAAASIPGWPASELPEVQTHDVNHDGLVELVVSFPSGLRMIRYDGTFSQAWSLPGRLLAGNVGSTDADAQDEFLCIEPGAGNVGAYAVYDGLGGAKEGLWPQFTNDRCFVLSGPWEQNGRNSLFFASAGAFAGPKPLNTMVRWNGSGYYNAFAFADTVDMVLAQRNRSATTWDLAEYLTNGDLVIRDAVNGSIRLQASRSLPGWTGIDLLSDPPTRGLAYDTRNSWETMINENGRFTAVRRNLTLDAAGEPGFSTPSAMRVLPSMPNPFRVATTLRFQVPRDGHAQIRIFDAAGRVVRTLDRALTAGNHTVEWDGLDDAGRPSPNGVLFYSVTVGAERQTMKLVRLR